MRREVRAWWHVKLECGHIRKTSMARVLVWCNDCNQEVRAVTADLVTQTIEQR